jgi:TDG/mug DNA glycosylase family protein
LTCLCSRATRGTDELAHEELTEGLRILKTKLERYRPKAICFNGVGIYESVTGTKPRVGYQGDDKIVPGISVFVMPSSRFSSFPPHDAGSDTSS